MSTCLCAGLSSYATAAVPATSPGALTVQPGAQPGSYALTWASAEPPPGFVFDVQVDYPGVGWASLGAGTTDLGETFAPSGPGPYTLRARMRYAASGVSSSWSTVTLPGAWPSFHFDQRHSGVTQDPAIGASAADDLAVAWKSPVNAGKPTFFASSPAIVFNAQLHRSVVFSATYAGVISARDLATGAVIWTVKGNGPVESSPTVLGNTVYIGTDGHRLLALNAATGAVQCSFSAGGLVISAPVVGSVDNTGPVVFFGDAGASEASNGGHEWAVTGIGNSGGACKQKWVFNAWANKGPADDRTGSWAPPALTTDATGRWLLVFGSSDPDDAVYALDARTGHVVWRFQTKVTNADADVGAAPAIGRPGANGLAHGAVYIDGKDKIEYAIDLLTGKEIWAFNLSSRAGIAGIDSVSSAALVGDQVIVPYARYVFSLDARTGAQMWRSKPAPGNYFSSPSVTGASGDQVVFIGDDSGLERAYRLADGTVEFQLKTGGSIYSSAAVAFGSVLFGSNDGNLYALG